MANCYKINTYTFRQWAKHCENDPQWLENVVDIVCYPNRFCMDIMATGKRILPILRKLEKSLSDAGEENFTAFVSGFISDIEDNGIDGAMLNYSGKDDMERGCWAYSWGIEDHDGCWYIFINSAV